MDVQQQFVTSAMTGEIAPAYVAVPVSTALPPVKRPLSPAVRRTHGGSCRQGRHKRVGFGGIAIGSSGGVFAVATCAYHSESSRGCSYCREINRGWQGREVRVGAGWKAGGTRRRALLSVWCRLGGGDGAAGPTSGIPTPVLRSDLVL